MIAAKTFFTPSLITKVTSAKGIAKKVNVNLIKAISALAFSLLLGMASPLQAASLPKQQVDLSINTMDNADLTVKGTSIFARKTLIDEELSIKGAIQQISIEDSSQDQVDGSSPYSEKQLHLLAGADYLYFDSSVSVNANYASADTGSLFDLYVQFGQEFENGISSVELGFGQGWEDDTDIGIHNKARSLSLGYNRYLRKTWSVHGRFELGSFNGDLVNFQNARRFNDASRTRLPSSRTERRLVLGSSNDFNKGRFVETQVGVFQNDWGQDGNQITLNYLKIQNDMFSYKLYIDSLSRDQSLYYSSNLLDVTDQVFASDDRHQAKIKTTQMGLTAQFKFKAELFERFNSPKLELGFSSIKNEFFLQEKIINSGKLIHLNLSTNY